MGLSPEEIEGASFSVAEEGYDRDAVDAFLAEVADSLRLARAALEQMSVPEGYVSPVLRRVHETAERITAEAQRESDAKRRRAEEEAASLRARAQRYANALAVEVHEVTSQLRKQQEALKERLTGRADDIRRRALTEATELKAAAEAEANAVRGEALERARALLQEAATRAALLEEAAGRYTEDLLAAVGDRLATVDRFEQDLDELVGGYQSQLEGMRTRRSLPQ